MMTHCLFSVDLQPVVISAAVGAQPRINLRSILAGYMRCVSVLRSLWQRLKTLTDNYLLNSRYCSVGSVHLCVCLRQTQQNQAYRH